MFKTLTILTICVLSFAPANSIAQVDNAKSGYEKAAKAYRRAASETSCPDRKAVFIKYAEWNERMLSVLAGTLSSPGEKPTIAVPPCDGDNMGSSGANGASNKPKNDAKEALDKLQAQKIKTNNTIDVVGNNVWDIIQSGRSKKAALTSQFVENFATDIFNNRLQNNLNLHYYLTDTECEKCNGTGTAVWDNTSGSLAGRSHICFTCAGTGKKFKLKVPFDSGMKDSSRPEVNELLRLLRTEVNMSKTNTYQFTLAGYRGTISLKIVNFYEIYEENLIVTTRYMFRFTKKNGEWDDNATFADSFDVEKVIPINSLRNIKIIPAEQKTNGENTITSLKHYVITASNGETIEFASIASDIYESIQAQLQKIKESYSTIDTPSAPAPKKKKEVKDELVNGIFAELETEKGNIVIRLEYQKAPITVANFISLAEGKNEFISEENLKGKPFYDGLNFHRVISDFMIQSGDPNGSGYGGAGYNFNDEMVPEFLFDSSGVLAMANSGANTNSSQFFITHKATPWLNGKHTIFGHVIAGQDVVNSISKGDILKKVTIIRKGLPAKAFDAVKVFSEYYNNRNKKVIEPEEDIEQINTKKEESKENDNSAIRLHKKKYFDGIKASSNTSATGLKYKIIERGSGIKPVNGSTIYVHYSGYLEDGSLFDTSYESVAKAYGKFDEKHAQQNGYVPFPFQAGKKDGLIPGFLEGLEKLSFGDKAVLFIPSSLGYGQRGAGTVIPPNSNIIFEIEIFETKPQ